MDMGAMVGQLVGGGVSGAIVSAIVGMVMNSMKSRALTPANYCCPAWVL